MHELLVFIVFVFHCDHKAFLYASEFPQPREEMKTLLNPKFLEYDAYMMFSQFLETAEPCFSTLEHDGQGERKTDDIHVLTMQLCATEPLCAPISFT